MTSNDLHQARLTKKHADLMAARATLDQALYEMTLAAIEGRDGAAHRAAADAALNRIEQINTWPLSSYSV